MRQEHVALRQPGQVIEVRGDGGAVLRGRGAQIDHEPALPEGREGRVVGTSPFVVRLMEAPRSRRGREVPGRSRGRARSARRPIRRTRLRRCVGIGHRPFGAQCQHRMGKRLEHQLETRASRARTGAAGASGVGTFMAASTSGPGSREHGRQRLAKTCRANRSRRASDIFGATASSWKEGRDGLRMSRRSNRIALAHFRWRSPAHCRKDARDPSRRGETRNAPCRTLRGHRRDVRGGAGAALHRPAPVAAASRGAADRRRTLAFVPGCRRSSSTPNWCSSSSCRRS